MRRLPQLAILIAVLVLAAPAAASSVLVYDDGHVTRADDPWLAPADPSNGGVGAPRECLAPSQPVAQTAAMSVRQALTRAYARRQIDRAAYSGYSDVYSKAKAAWRRLSGNRHLQLGSVIASVNELAARKLLSASRMPPVFLELERNTQWWSHTSVAPPTAPTPKPPKSACTTAARIAAGPRVQFKGDPLTLQYYPGAGLRIQPLANWGAANALYNACVGVNTAPGTPCELDKLRALLDRLIAMGADRGGFLAWEYYFPIYGGRPPWVSGIATGAALSALSRSAALFEQQQPVPQDSGGAAPPGGQAQPQPQHDGAYYLAAAKRALPIYQHKAPLGIRLPTARGNHYLIYSFARGMLVGNAFLESLVGLWDYWHVSGDRTAGTLFARGDREARHELPLLDTGAWSLYSVHGAEADLNYQRAIRDFTRGLCERTNIAAYCHKAAAWDADLHRPAKVVIVGPKTARASKATRIALHVDKITCLTIKITRGTKVVYQPTWYFPRGTHSFVWTPPKAGAYHVHVLSRDLVNHQSRADADMRVLSRR